MVPVWELNDLTKVVKFYERTPDVETYVRVIKGTGCWSYVGEVAPYLDTTYQDLSLGDGCVHHGIIQHEFLHALGFWHEHSRSDRDSYVQINWDNIDEEYADNFDLEEGDGLSNLETDYDYGSVMHYGAYAFSKNGEKTIDSFGNDIGQREQASDEDIFNVQLLYQCESNYRTKSSWESHPCTSGCKCWAGAAGCGTNSNACQGSLTCQENICSAAPTISPAPSISFEPSKSPNFVTTNVHARYYDALTQGWGFELPASRLWNFTAYKEELIEGIEFPSTTDSFAGSGKTDHVGALFQGML